MSYRTFRQIKSWMYRSFSPSLLSMAGRASLAIRADIARWCSRIFPLSKRYWGRNSTVEAAGWTRKEKPVT